MSKKIFIIFGHNRYKSGSSFNAAIRDTFIEEASSMKVSLIAALKLEPDLYLL